MGSTLRYHASVLLHAGRHLDVLIEGFGRTDSAGPDRDEAALSVAPGLRLRPLADRPLVLGAGVALPVTGEPEVDARVLVSAFYHF
ncbi:MAG: hypothetical protein GWM90_26170 [Gemmatimonadetes bacterium]|nr:hypothetical protein [Gemmatimonadota bacterium]NIQ58375.1 hypothetical protein [Gemmatimonadota bacterium]NIU78591.1 hypothetical protein [Gammaproteobacteria bacterium]NIX47431.1 hypothetical protein [Gemmatimonadota bacterium]NIY11814.1 hypothetical protein [Gemmatimonadota bacterium]